MELFELVTQYCDIRLLKSNCNFRNCDRAPKMELLVYQIDMIMDKKRDIISLYLCPDHYAEMERRLGEVVEKIKGGKTYKIKHSEDKGIHIVTY
jgi:hypothetical protein